MNGEVAFELVAGGLVYLASFIIALLVAQRAHWSPGARVLLGIAAGTAGWMLMTVVFGMFNFAGAFFYGFLAFALLALWFWLPLRPKEAA